MAAITICPICDKEIFQGIKKCLHCGHFFETGAGDIPAPERTAPSVEINTETNVQPETDNVISGLTKFRIGACVWQSVSLTLRNIVPFFIITLAVKIPFLIITIGFDLSAINDVALNLLASLVSYIAIASIAYSVISELRGQSIGIMASLEHTLPYVWKVILAAIISLVVIFLISALGSGVLGWFALLSGLDWIDPKFIALVVIGIIPGLFFTLLYWLVVPVVVVENKGILASLPRSAALTKNNRWKIVAVLLLSTLLSIIPYIALIVPLRDLTAADISNGAPNVIILMYLASTLSSIFFSVVQTVTYHDLRTAKEGVGSDQVASVFN